MYTERTFKCIGHNIRMKNDSHLHEGKKIISRNVKIAILLSHRPATRIVILYVILNDVKPDITVR